MRLLHHFRKLLSKTDGTSSHHIIKWRMSSLLATAIVLTHSNVLAQCGWSNNFGLPPGGKGMNGPINDMATFDDTSVGPQVLIAGGEFTVAGSATHVAKFNGTQWTAIGNGTTNGVVRAVTTRTGTPFGLNSPGSEIFAGGSFTTIGGASASHVALWDGTNWRGLQDLTPANGTDGTNGDVYSMLTYDFPNIGPMLFAGGQFTTAGGRAAQNVAAWDGGAWNELRSCDTCATSIFSSGRVEAMCVFDDHSGSGPELYVAGSFSGFGGTLVSLVAKFTPLSQTATAVLGVWRPVGTLAFPFSGPRVNDLTVFDDGSGSGLQLFAGGSLPGAFGNVAKWNGTDWVPIGAGVDDEVTDLLTYQCGGATQLIASGRFTASTSGTFCPLVAQWNGADWQPMDSGSLGLGGGFPGSAVARCMVDFKDAADDRDLFVGGVFTTAENQSSTFVAATCACRDFLPVRTGAVAVTTMGHGGSPYVLHLVDVRNPQDALPNMNWGAPMFHNEFAPSAPSEVWSVANLGQVFGVCFDRQSPPNIYVAATSVYSSDVYGPAGSGGVYQINGTTGDITTFLTTGSGGIGTNQIPNYGPPIEDGPGLGDICYDRFHDQFFVSNFDDGKIYRIKSGVVVETLDPFAADDGEVGYAPLGERVWAVQMFSGRELYFSRWREDASTGASSGNQICVAGIGSTGEFLTFFPILPVLTLPRETGQTSLMPCSDIRFSPDNKRMLIAERSMNASESDYHDSAVFEFVGGSVGNGAFNWTRSNANQYWIGNHLQSLNATGGADYDCDYNVFATGDALNNAYTPNDQSDTVYGLQRIPSGGNSPGAGATSTSQIQDMNGNLTTADKTEIGECEIFRPDCESTHFKYGHGKVNSLGCTPGMDAIGASSATAANGFTVQCTQVMGQKAGLLFYGFGGPAALPFQGGTLLVASPLKRTPVLNSGGTNFACDGVFVIDMNAYAATGADPALLVPGTIVNCEVWSRDPGSPSTTSLSDALEYNVGQ